MKYIPHTTEDIRQMLAVIGVDKVEDLYAEVPEELKLKQPLGIPSAQSEIEVRRIVGEMAAQNKVLVPFAGAGSYDHYTPSLIPYITSRSEFSTSYTPYQAEISQGTLAYIFEYQTMMARLTGMDISNASMYDGATATAEAMLMMVAASKRRKKVLVSSTLLPEVRQVVQTYAHYHGVEVHVIGHQDGVTDRAEITAALSGGDVAGVIVAQPNRFGIVEDLTGLADEVHAAGALLAVNAVASTLAVLRSPGEWGADIACGDAQSLGLPLNFGGPYIGYMCVKKALVRKMPGRLVGETTDADGRRCFVLTMQAREQHIRREKATSNICTAQGIMCLWVAIYLSLMGPEGLKEVNDQSYAAAHSLHDALVNTGLFAEAFPGKPFVNEFTLRFLGEEGVPALRQRMAKAGFLAGVVTEGEPDCITFAATERRTPDEVQRFLRLIQQ